MSNLLDAYSALGATLSKCVVASVLLTLSIVFGWGPHAWAAWWREDHIDPAVPCTLQCADPFPCFLVCGNGLSLVQERRRAQQAVFVLRLAGGYR